MPLQAVPGRQSHAVPVPSSQAIRFSIFSSTVMWVGVMTASVLFALNLPAACQPCNTFQPGIVWGQTSIKSLSEASGLGVSARNPGVLWTHNDGSRKRAFAISTNGTTLAVLTFDLDLDDVEDMAVGPGPSTGVSYLYFGDIGGNSHDGDVREDVRIHRVPEPQVELSWAGSPRTNEFAGVESFTLVYPDGQHDAETLLVDPISGDLFVVTKENDQARAYRANLNATANGSTLNLTLVQTVEFAKAAGGDISADGKQIALRRENAAMVWARCDGESVGAALGRPGQSIPVIGPPTEDNGEAIAFLRDGSGYVTISEGDDPPIHFFRSNCLVPSPVLRISTNGTMLRIAFDAVAGRKYTLEYRVDLVAGAWSSTGLSLQPTFDGPHHFEVEKPSTETFYCVVAQ